MSDLLEHGVMAALGTVVLFLSGIPLTALLPIHSTSSVPLTLCQSPNCPPNTAHVPGTSYRVSLPRSLIGTAFLHTSSDDATAPSRSSSMPNLERSPSLPPYHLRSALSKVWSMDGAHLQTIWKKIQLEFLSFESIYSSLKE